MVFKGTKGKWMLGNDGVIITENLRLVADCMVLCDEDYYNAKLISKAPELLEMLERVNYYIENDINVSEYKIEIETLIKESIEL